MKIKKTNASRILDNLKIKYRLLEYEVDENNLIVSNKVRKNHNTPIKAYAAKSFCWIALTISGFIYERLLDQSSLYSII